MARLLLHAGTGKTGTTSIQTAIKRNETALAEMGYRALRSNQVAADRSVKHSLYWRNFDDPSWKILEAEIEQIRNTDACYILSNETLYRRKDESLNYFRDLFDGFEISVIMYIRHQAEFFQSLVLQNQKKQHKSFNFHSPVAFEAWRSRRNENYLEVASKLENVFGAESLHIRLFHPDAFEGGSLLGDFFTTAGIPDLDSLDLNVNSNQSLTVEYADVLRVHHEVLTEKARWSEVLGLALSLSSTFGRERYFLTEHQVTAINEEYAESNRQLFARYVENAGSFPSRRVWTNNEPIDLDALCQRMLTELDDMPLLAQRGWNRKRGLSRRLFQSGFQLGVGEEGVRAVQSNPTATIRFRIPFRGRALLGKTPLSVHFECSGDTVVKVDVNQSELGEIDLAQDPILVPIDLIGELDKIEITLTEVANTDTPLQITGLAYEAPEATRPISP